MNATDSGVPLPPRIATSSALCPPSTRPATIQATQTPSTTRRFTRSETESVCVFENQCTRERERRSCPEDVERAIGVETLVVDEPEVRPLGESVAQADVEVETVRRRIELDERVPRRPRVE